MRNEKGQFVKGFTPWSKGTKGIIKSWNKGKVGVYSEETIKKMSLAKKGKSSWNKGRKLSEEHKQRLIALHKGKKLSKESIEKRTKTRKENGYKHSEETKLKMRFAAVGRRHSEESKKKISEVGKGRVPWNKGLKGYYSEEILKKISEAGKGRIPWMKGKKHSEETLKKISETGKGRIGYWSGKKRSEETRKKVSESQKGKRIGEKNPFYGKKHTEETRKKISEAIKGEKSYFWQGGKSFEPYGLEFNNDLKEVIRNRDRRKCQLCNITELDYGELLSIHHMDYDKKNNNPNNLITLCRRCHAKTNIKRGYWITYFNGGIK